MIDFFDIYFGILDRTFYKNLHRCPFVATDSSRPSTDDFAIRNLYLYPLLVVATLISLLYSCNPRPMRNATDTSSIDLESLEYPDAVVFDLDYTLWPCWCDTHLSPPIKRGTSDLQVEDRSGYVLSLYRDVPEILKHLREKNVKILAASRTATPDVAKSILKTIKIDGEPVLNYFDALEWGQGTKINHFKKLNKKTKVDFNKMIFFDDERRNKDVERSLGVMFNLVDESYGVNWSEFKRAIKGYNERLKSGL